MERTRTCGAAPVMRSRCAQDRKIRLSAARRDPACAGHIPAHHNGQAAGRALQALAVALGLGLLVFLNQFLHGLVRNLLVAADFNTVFARAARQRTQAC